MFFVFVGMMGYSTVKYIQESKKEESWINPQAFLVVAVIQEFFAILFKVLDLSIYMYDGEGTVIFRAFSTINQVLSGLTIITLLMLLAYGWTLHRDNLADFEIIGVVSFVVIAFHALVGVVTVIDHEEKHKYHDYAGIQGLVLVLARFALYAAFMYGLWRTMDKVTGKTSQFLVSLAFAGTLYILSFPALYFMSYVVEPVL